MMKRTVALWMSAPLLLGLALPTAVQGKDKEKRAKVKWKEVAVLAKEPGGKECELIETFYRGTMRWTPFTTDRSMRKSVMQQARKKGGKMGANAVLLSDVEANAFNASGEVKAYWCEKMPPGAVFDND